MANCEQLSPRWPSKTHASRSPLGSRSAVTRSSCVPRLPLSSSTPRPCWDMASFSSRSAFFLASASSRLRLCSSCAAFLRAAPSSPSSCTCALSFFAIALRARAATRPSQISRKRAKLPHCRVAGKNLYEYVLVGKKNSAPVSEEAHTMIRKPSQIHTIELRSNSVNLKGTSAAMSASSTSWKVGRTFLFVRIGTHSKPALCAASGLR